MGRCIMLERTFHTWEIFPRKRNAHVWEDFSCVRKLAKHGKASHMLEDVPCVGMLTICRKASHISAVLKPMFIFKPLYSLFVVIEQSKHANVVPTATHNAEPCFKRCRTCSCCWTPFYVWRYILVGCAGRLPIHRKSPHV